MGTSTFATLGLGALAPYLRSTFNLSTFEVGALPALVFLGAFSVSIPSGRLTDRVGAGRALVISQLGVSAGIGLAAIAPNAEVFLVAVFLAGIGYGSVNPATNVLVHVARAAQAPSPLPQREADRGHARRAGWRRRVAGAGRRRGLARRAAPAHRHDARERARRGLGGGSRGQRLVRRARLGPRA